MKVRDNRTKVVYHFPCHRWIAEDSLEGKTVVELRAVRGPGDAAGRPTVEYMVRTFTGDLPGSVSALQAQERKRPRQSPFTLPFILARFSIRPFPTPSPLHSQGSDANVSCVLRGPRGDTDRITLTCRPEDFQRAKIDTASGAASLRSLPTLRLVCGAAPLRTFPAPAATRVCASCVLSVL